MSRTSYAAVLIDPAKQSLTLSHQRLPESGDD